MANDAYYIAKYEKHLQLLEDAKEAGFLNCTEIIRGLGYDTQKVSAQGAFWQIDRAGEEVVILIPDGQGYYIDGERKTISKFKRWGVYAPAFEKIKAYHDEHRKRRLREEWESNLAGAYEARVEEGAQTEFMDWDANIADLLANEPPEPDLSVLDAAHERRRAKDVAKRQAKAEEREEKAEERQAKAAADEEQVAKIVALLPTYDSEYNKKGKPKIVSLSFHVGFKVTRWQRNKAWSRYQEGLMHG